MTITTVVEYDDPSQHQFDPEKVEISGSQVQLKSQVLPSEIFYWNFVTDASFASERNIGAYTLVPTGLGPQVDGGWLEMLLNDASFATVSNVTDIINDFAFHIKVRVNFSTIVTSERIAQLTSNVDSSAVVFNFVNQGGGVTRIVQEIYNVAGTLSHSDIIGTFSFNPGDIFDIGIKRETGTSFVSYVDGIPSNVASDVTMNFTDIDIVLGDSSSTNVSYDDLILWSDNVSLLYPGVHPDYYLYTLQENLFFTTIPFLMDQILSFSTSEFIPDPETSVGYYFLKNLEPLWYNMVSGEWEESDQTIAQTNTAAEINTNLGTFPLSENVGAFIQVSSVLVSNTGYDTMLLDSFTLTYDFTFEPQEVQKAVVYGTVVDNSGLGVLNATVEFDTRNRIQENNMVFPKVKTTTNEEGQWALSLIETETSDASGTFLITYDNDGTSESEEYRNRIIPANTPLIQFENLPLAP